MKRQFSTKTALVCILSFILTLGGGMAMANAFITPAVKGSDVIVSGCVIRFSNANGTPSIHANGAHQCAGVESVGINSAGQVQVIQSVKNPAKNTILFAQCQADETLGGARGIICGASGGTDQTSFSLYDTRINRFLNMNNASDRMRVQGKNSNLWVGWFHRPVN